MEQFTNSVTVACSINTLNFKNLMLMELYEYAAADPTCFFASHSDPVIEALETLSTYITNIVINLHSENKNTNDYISNLNKLKERIDDFESYLKINTTELEEEFQIVLNAIRIKLNNITVKNRRLSQVLFQLPNSVFFIYR